MSEQEPFQQERVVFRFRPDAVTWERWPYADTANEYVIEMIPEADSGVVLWGYFEKRKRWIANPSARAVLYKLLQDRGLI